MMRVRKAVIPAAGLGTRFLPATKAQPKEMLPIVDKPTIQYIVEEAAASGIEDIILLVGGINGRLKTILISLMNSKKLLQRKKNINCLRIFSISPV